MALPRDTATAAAAATKPEAAAWPGARASGAGEKGVPPSHQQQQRQRQRRAKAKVNYHAVVCGRWDLPKGTQLLPHNAPAGAGKRCLVRHRKPTTRRASTGRLFLRHHVRRQKSEGCVARPTRMLSSRMFEPCTVSRGVHGQLCGAFRVNQLSRGRCPNTHEAGVAEDHPSHGDCVLRCSLLH